MNVAIVSVNPLLAMDTVLLKARSKYQAILQIAVNEAMLLNARSVVMRSWGADRWNVGYGS